MTNEEKALVINYLNRPRISKRNRPLPTYKTITYYPFSDVISISYVLEDEQDEWEMTRNSYLLLVEEAKLCSK